MPKNSFGFTLVELLITISIIAVVFGVIISSGLALQKNSRDAQRQADLKNIQSALQQFYADHQYFPMNSEVATDQPLKSRDTTKTYLNKIPSGPRAGDVYCYASMVSFSDATACTVVGDRCHYYRIMTNLEGGSTCSSNCTCGGTTYNYQVNPL